MGARVGDGIAGATNVEEGEPLVPGARRRGSKASARWRTSGCAR